MKIFWTGFLAALLLGCAAATPAAAQTAPSFDCAKAATVIEKAICGDPQLAEADATMSRLFAATRVSAFGVGPSNTMPGQIKWLREREQCAVPGKSPAKLRECLVLEYTVRNEDLAVAALFTAPDLALATLRDLDDGYGLASLYEAVYRYASHPADTDWTAPAMAAERRQLEQLLAADFTRLRDDATYGWDILRDKVDTLDKATASEENFAMTIGILAAYADGDYKPMTIPCAALVRHPELKGATYPEFGSGLDSGIPYSNCDATLPPLPRLDALVAQISKNWPNCEGSIRFSAYRWYEVALDDARLFSEGAEAGGKMPVLDGVPPAMVDAAIAELTAYYRKYLRPGPNAARGAIRDILEHSHKCGED
jgi:hypothetical protein